MAEDGLDGANVGSVVVHAGGHGVAEAVASFGLVDACRLDVATSVLGERIRVNGSAVSESARLRVSVAQNRGTGKYTEETFLWCSRNAAERWKHQSVSSRDVATRMSESRWWLNRSSPIFTGRTPWADAQGYYLSPRSGLGKRSSAARGTFDAAVRERQGCKRLE